MKKQQVNLYKSLPHISRNWFGEMVVLQIASVFIALLFLVTFVQIVMLQWDKYHVNSLQKKYIENNTRFSKEQQGQSGVDLLQLQQELASQKQLFNLLHIKTQAEGCPLLSNYFQSFSGAQTAGLWLTRFRIEPDTRNMTLEGETYEPLLIVNWIKQLGKTPCFTGAKFHTINIEKDAAAASKLMTFNITSNSTPAAAKPVGEK